MLLLNVNLPLEAAAQRIERELLLEGSRVEFVDRFYRQGPGGAVMTVVYEWTGKRKNTRAGLTVTITNVAGVTEVWAQVAFAELEAQAGVLGIGAKSPLEISIRKSLEGFIL